MTVGGIYTASFNIELAGLVKRKMAKYTGEPAGEPAVCILTWSDAGPAGATFIPIGKHDTYSTINSANADLSGKVVVLTGTSNLGIG